MKKKCLICDEIKSLDNFSPMKSGKQGVHSYCKPCRSKQNTPKFALWVKANREKVNLYQKKYQRRLRAIAKELKNE